MTDNHGYETPEKGATEWHESLNRNFRHMDRDVEIRDFDAAKDNYRPKSGAKFLATDTENVYIGDGSQWLRLATSGQDPLFGTVSTKKIVDRNSGNGYSIDELAGGSGGGGVNSTADVFVKLESGVPTAYRAEGRQIAQEGDAAVVFQAAFDEVDSNNGGTVHVGPGEFPVDQDITLYSNTTFVGAGMGQTVLKATSQANFGSYGGAPFPTNVRIQDFTYDGQNQGGKARVFSGGARRCTALRVAVLNCGEREGPDTSGGLAWRTLDPPTYNRIIDCYAENCSHVSLSVQKGGGYNEIRGCTVVNPNTSGGFTHPISIESNTNSVMTNNIVIGDDSGATKAGSPALNANATHACVVSNNSVRYADNAINIANGGTSTDRRAGAVVDGNSINHCGEGIRLQNTSTTRPPEEIVVSNNLIRDIDGPGVLFNNNARATVVGNNIIRCNRGIKGFAIGGPITVSSNYFKNADLRMNNYNLNEFDGSPQRSLVQGNHLRNTQAIIGAPTLFTGNVRDGATGGGVRFNEPSFIFGNTVKSRNGTGTLNPGPSNLVIGNDVDELVVGSLGSDGMVALNQAQSYSGDLPGSTNIQFNTGGAIVTENGGSASVADGDTISHGLTQAPNIVNLTASKHGHIASASTIDDSSINIELVNDGGSRVSTTEIIYWEAKVR